VRNRALLQVVAYFDAEFRRSNARLEFLALVEMVAVLVIAEPQFGEHPSQVQEPFAVRREPDVAVRLDGQFDLRARRRIGVERQAATARPILESVDEGLRRCAQIFSNCLPKFFPDNTRRNASA
jgi:hypothetical protein